MIRELFHHEYLTTRKALATIAGWIFLVGVASLVPVAIPVPFVENVGFLLAILSFASLAPVLFGYLVYNYWQTMYGRRGYFTMTLPVRGRAIFAVKTIYALLTVVLGCAVSVLGVWLFTVALDLGQRVSLGTVWSSLISAITEEMGNAVAPLLLIIAAQVVFYVVSILAMMSVSAQARFQHLGIGAPVIGGILLYLAYYLTSLLAMMFIPLGVVLVGPDAGSIVAQGMWQELLDLMSGSAAQADSIPEVLGMGMLISVAVTTALMVWWGVRSIERKTSLR
ncbi:MAG: hypothetical protein QM705_01705 [Ancrocorticia sp.]